MNFKQSDVVNLYNQVRIQGGSSLGLIVALYDTIIRDLRRAERAIERGDIEKRTFELNHAFRVIAELENALDHGRGGKAAARLRNFYAVTRGMILQASINNSRAAIAQLIEIFTTMRQAWHAADLRIAGEHKLPVEDLNSLPGKTSTKGSVAGTPPSDAPSGNWSA
jgi:flagellar secretion chaperone FliS